MAGTLGGGSGGMGSGTDTNRLPRSKYWAHNRPIDEQLEAGEKGHPVSPDPEVVDQKIMQEKEGSAVNKLERLKELNTLKNIKISKYKQANKGKMLRNMLKSPAGGEGFKGGLRQAGSTAVDFSPFIGAGVGGKIYGEDPNKKATALSSAILLPWLATRGRTRYKESLKSGKKGMGLHADVLGKSTPELAAKLGVGAGAYGLDYGMEKGPELAKKWETITQNLEDTTGNVSGITAQANKDEALGGILKDVKGLSGTVSDLTKDFRPEDFEGKLSGYDTHIQNLRTTAENYKIYTDKMKGLDPNSPQYKDLLAKQQDALQKTQANYKELSELVSPTPQPSSVDKLQEATKEMQGLPDIDTSKVQQWIDKAQKGGDKVSLGGGDIVNKAEKAIDAGTQAAKDISEAAQRTTGEESLMGTANQMWADTTNWVKAHPIATGLSAAGVAGVAAYFLLRKSKEEKKKEEERLRAAKAQAAATRRLARAAEAN
jgi:hypothetical protein